MDWGESFEEADSRGSIMADYLSARELLLMNIPEQGATFKREVMDEATGKKKVAQSWIDLTFTNDLQIAGGEWTMRDCDTNHRLIEVVIDFDKEREFKTTKKYNLKKLNMEKFMDIVNKNKPELPKSKKVEESKLERVASEWLRVVKIALEHSAPKKKPNRDGFPGTTPSCTRRREE